MSATPVQIYSKWLNKNLICCKTCKCALLYQNLIWRTNTQYWVVRDPRIPLHKHGLSRNRHTWGICTIKFCSNFKFFLETMHDYSNCFNSNVEKLKKLFREKTNEGRVPLLTLILTIILNILKMAPYYCFCEYKKRCLVCTSVSHFKNVQYGLYQHSTEFCPANLIIPDLLSCLSSICQFNSHFVCATVNTKYYYTAENWFSGKKATFTIEEALEKWQNSLKKPIVIK